MWKCKKDMDNQVLSVNFENEEIYGQLKVKVYKVLINEITYLDEIFNLEKKKEDMEHINISNISYWNLFL